MVGERPGKTFLQRFPEFITFFVFQNGLHNALVRKNVCASNPSQSAFLEGPEVGPQARHGIHTKLRHRSLIIQESPNLATGSL